MKTRAGFVSNSSTSSFCIYGIIVEEDVGRPLIDMILDKTFPVGEEFFAKVKRYFLEDEGTQEQIDNQSEEYKQFIEDYLLDFIDGIELPDGLSIERFDEDDYTYIGRDIDELDDDETKREFRASVEDALTKIFGKQIAQKAGWHEGTCQC